MIRIADVGILIFIVGRTIFWIGDLGCVYNVESELNITLPSSLFPDCGWMM